MADYSQYINEYIRAAPDRAAGSVDENPDDAARALDLEKASGTPAAVIHADLDTFEQQHKAAIASNLVKSNPYLRDYINSHELAAALSNDDYGNLDAASEAMEKLPFHRKFAASIHNAIQQSIGLTAEGLGYLAGIEGTKGATERFTASARRKFGDDAPAFEAFEKTIPGMVGGGIGSIVALAPSLAGGIAPAALQMGIMSGAGQQIRASKLGASEEDQASMFTGGFVVGTAAGAVPLHMLLGGTKPAVEGFVNAATSKLLTATKMGGLFVGLGEAQHALEEQIAKKVDPNAGYHPDTNRMAASFILGSALGLTVQRARPWVEAGKDVPRGIDPLIDASKEHQNKADLDALDESLKAAVKTGTRERSPEMYAAYARQHLGDGKIGISGERIAELYGHKDNATEIATLETQLEQLRKFNKRVSDVNSKRYFKGYDDPEYMKTVEERARQIDEENALAEKINDLKQTNKKNPHPDDNLLGWVPGIKEQLEAARETGQDVQIPIADWLAKVDPAIAKELHDDTRVRPGNITKAEAELAKEQPPAIPVDSPLAQVRGASALEPAFSIGDRRLELKRLSQVEDKASYHATVEGKKWDTLTDAEKKPYLDRAATEVPDKPLYGADFHDFKLIDENGRNVGTINLSATKGGKQLYIEMINGINGLGPRDFGLSLMRDLLRQLKAEFPEAETITGHRVSGARDKAGSFDRPSAQPVVKLDAIDDLAVRELQGALQEAYWENFSQTLSGALKPTELYTKHEADLVKVVNEELARITPKKVEVQEVSALDIEGLKRQPSGAHVQYTDRPPVILWSLNSPDAIGVARHEAIHHLRQYQFFKPEEWNTLAQAAKDGNWLEQYKIDKSYSKLSDEAKLEEAVAEAFRGWAQQKDRVANRLKEAVGFESSVERIFRKLQDFLDAIGKRFKEILGHEPTWEELFESAFKGDIGSREGGKPLNPEAFRLSQADRLSAFEKDRIEFAKTNNLSEITDAEMVTLIQQRIRQIEYDRRQHKVEGQEYGAYPELTELRRRVKELRNPEALEARLSIEDRADMLRANATGLDLVSFKRLQKLIEKRHEEDYAAAMKRAEREQRLRQSDEWKAKSAEIRPQVVEDIRSRPDVAADEFLRNGELFGKKLDKPIRLKADELSPEQAASLPKSYVAKSGAPIDEVANLFGFRTGDEMVNRLAQLHADREASGKNPDMFRRQMIDDEVTRRMEKEHGFLEKNIIEEAHDQALSNTQLDILAEEMHAAGMMAKVATIDKNVATKWARDAFAKLTVGDVSSDHFMAQIGKWGREAERALIANKPAEAVQFMQKKFLNALMAKQAKELEVQIARFDRDAKRLGAREIANMEPEYLNFVHQILMQVGKPVKRSVQDLAEAIDASGHKNLEEFVVSKSGMLRELPVPDFLYDPKFRKPTEALTVDEFRAVQDAVKAMAHNGRDELKIYKAGEAADFNEKKSQMMEQLEQFAVKHYDSKGKRWMGPIPPGPAKIIRTYLAAHMQLENVMARWDKFDPRGVWSQYVMRDLVEGSNQEAAWGKEYARRFAEMDDKADVRKAIDNQLFRDPLGGELLNLNRGNLRSIILNAGNESNLGKLAKGYKLEPQQVLDWIHQHATKEDWAWAQKVWDMFSDIKSRSDTMYRSLTGGVAPEAIDVQPIKTPHGEVKGGYYPIIFHPEFEGKSKNLLGRDPLEQENYIRATTPAGYTKERTGYTAPLALDLDALPGQIRSMLHDIALRPAVINASKVMYDQQIRAEIGKRYGTEYRDLLIPYIRDVANSANYVAKDQRLFSQASEFIRQNMISTLVGFNVGTVMKHGPTAWVQSMHEVGSVPFLRELKSLFSVNETTGETNWKFAMETSQELQRRDRNYRETLSGAIEEFAPTGKFNSLRQTVLSYASKPVALSDIISAVPTWLAKYRQVMEDTGVHGDAIFEADRAVRRAHGSTAITNRPSVMRGGTLVQWFASVYGFFNHIMNRQAELVWRAGDTLNMVKEGEFKSAMGEVPRLTAMLFAYVLAPAMIEEMVTPLASKDGESWGKKAAKGIGFTLGASWVGIRDISSALLNDRDPSAGLISTAFKQALNIKRDFAKDRPLSKEHAGKLIQDASGMFGTLTGLTPQPLGRAARFGFNVGQGLERPKGPWGWMVGLRYGTLDKHSTTFSDWTKHH